MHIFQSDTAVFKGESESSSRQMLQTDKRQIAQKSTERDQIKIEETKIKVYTTKHEGNLNMKPPVAPSYETNSKSDQVGNKKDDQKALVNKQEEIASSNPNSLDKVESKCAKQFLIVNRNISLSPTPKTLEVKTPASFAQVTSEANKSLEKVSVSYVSNDNYHQDTSIVSGQIYKANRSTPKKNSKPETELDKEIATLDKSYAEKIEKIGDKYKPEKKIDLSKKDVNINRPAILGPSRFESGIRRPSPTLPPSRNESVFYSKENASKATSSSQPATSGFSLSKSQTTADILSPETRRKRFDSNFNAVPEPFKTSEAPDTSKYSKNYEAKYSTKQKNVSMLFLKIMFSFLAFMIPMKIILR